MKRYWKIIIAQVVILIAGIALGFVAGAMRERAQIEEERRAANQRGADMWAMRTQERLNEQLELGPEQKEKIRPLVKATGEELHGFRREAMKQSYETVRGFYEELETILSEEQVAIMEEHRNRIRQRMEEEGDKRRMGDFPGKPPGLGPGDGRFKPQQDGERRPQSREGDQMNRPPGMGQPPRRDGDPRPDGRRPDLERGNGDKRRPEPKPDA